MKHTEGIRPHGLPRHIHQVRMVGEDN
ncbi:MAG: hypothetical protein RLZZ618_3153, partial [Pseudomonadota bacterium]